MMQRITVYEDLHTAIKNVKYRIIAKLTVEDKVVFRVSKDKLKDDGFYLVRYNYLENQEVLFSSCNSEEQAKEMIKSYNEVPKASLRHYKLLKSLKDVREFINLEFNTIGELLRHLNKEYGIESKQEQNIIKSAPHFHYDDVRETYYVSFFRNSKTKEVI